MPCCASGLRQLIAATGSARLEQTPTTGNPRAPAQAGMRFVYEGETALTVVGRVTGRRYRFSYPGAQLAIDPRDVKSVGRVPVLRRVTHG